MAWEQMICRWCGGEFHGWHELYVHVIEMVMHEDPDHEDTPEDFAKYGRP